MQKLHEPFFVCMNLAYPFSYCFNAAFENI